MHQFDFFIFGLVLIIPGIILFIVGFFWFKQKQLIENTPTSNIRSIAMGLVEIFGEAVPSKNILKSPFSKSDCVYYRYTIEEYRRSGKHSQWVTIKHDEQRPCFYLKDDTGAVLVNPEGAKIDIPLDNEFHSSVGKDPPDAVKQFLDNCNIRFEGLILGINKTMRFKEYFIAPGDKLYIMGAATDNPFVEDATVEKGVEDVMIHKGEQEKFYYISDKTEREVLKGYSMKTIGGIGVGSILVVVGLILLFW